jgi:2-C-methyl-D-erythritol 4-phosphate cytidylyltransferase
MRVVAIVLAAGSGERLGAGVPKGWVRLQGRSVLEWSVLALASASGVDAILPVVPGAFAGRAAASALPVALSSRAAAAGIRLLDAVAGGESRQDSLAAGLGALEPMAPAAEWVLVHDAARCLVEPVTVEAVLRAAQEHGAALPVVPVADTLKQVAGDRVVATVPRAGLAAAQTPQGFRIALLRQALEKAQRDGFAGTDCASLVERLGVAVAAVPGSPGNFKITTPEDRLRAEVVLRARGPREV